MTNNILFNIPNLDFEEVNFLQNLMKDMSENQQQQFVFAYNSKRVDPTTILLVTLVGFIGIAGIQRFMTERVGLGLLYLFTGGLCMVGTIVDLINYKKIALEANIKNGYQVASFIKNTIQ